MSERHRLKLSKKKSKAYGWFRELRDQVTNFLNPLYIYIYIYIYIYSLALLKKKIGFATAPNICSSNVQSRFSIYISNIKNIFTFRSSLYSTLLFKKFLLFELLLLYVQTTLKFNCLRSLNNMVIYVKLSI